MANPEHLAILKQGVKAWNEWRKEHPESIPDLEGLNLRGAFLREADMRGANLRGTDLEQADLRKGDLTRADLRSALLNGADLAAADLSEAILERADLNGAFLQIANLRNAYLTKAHLNGTDLMSANLEEAHLNGADMDKASCYLANLKRADLSGATLSLVNFIEADLTGANLSHAILAGANFCNANLSEAVISNSLVYGISVWNLRGLPKEQSDLIITPTNESTVTVDNLEIAQFLYLLLNNEKIRGVIDTIARKVVLILGRFKPERKAVLDAIREELRSRDYVPVLFVFDKPAARDITETMRTLAHLSRFIIADLSDPSSIPLELQAVVPDLAVPVQPLLLSGQHEFSMFVDLRKKYHWVLATHQYTDIADLLASLGDKVIAPAEQKARELEKR